MEIIEDHDECLSFEHNIICPSCGYTNDIVVRLDFSQSNTVGASAHCKDCGSFFIGHLDLDNEQEND